MIKYIRGKNPNSRNGFKKGNIGGKLGRRWKIKDTSNYMENINGFKKGNKINVGKRNAWKDALTTIQKQEQLAGKKRPEQCEICGAMGRICFDHDHKTGEFRGWICQRCNLTLGNVKDSIDLLEALIEYLKKC